MAKKSKNQTYLPVREIPVQKQDKQSGPRFNSPEHNKRFLTSNRGQKYENP